MKLILFHLCFYFHEVVELIIPCMYFVILVEGDGLGEGYGMLGQAGSGKLRVSIGQSKLAAKVAKKYAFAAIFVFILVTNLNGSWWQQPTYSFSSSWAQHNNIHLVSLKVE